MRRLLGALRRRIRVRVERAPLTRRQYIDSARDSYRLCLREMVGTTGPLSDEDKADIARGVGGALADSLAYWGYRPAADREWRMAP